MQKFYAGSLYRVRASITREVARTCKEPVQVDVGEKPSPVFESCCTKSPTSELAPNGVVPEYEYVHSSTGFSHSQAVIHRPKAAR